MRALPGVTAASLGAVIPPAEWPGRRAVFTPGQEPPQEVLQGSITLGTWVDSNVVSPGYFRTLGIPLVQGRDFSGQDGGGAPRVGIVGERLAQRLWPGKNPLGRRIAVPEWSGPPRPPVEIVGVARDVASRSLLGEAPLQLYLPVAQEYGGRLALVVRSGVAAIPLVAALRDAVRRLDPRLPLFALETMPEHIAASLWRQRIAAALLALFSLLAVALASIGLYGVVAHSAVQRTREIGIRVAIGARRGEVCGLIIREGMAWIGVGIVAGVPAALLATMAAQKVIPGARPFDPLSFGATLLVLAAASLLASYLPARRASRLDPSTALRCE